jgi:hypothetical protein
MFAARENINMHIFPALKEQKEMENGLSILKRLQYTKGFGISEYWFAQTADPGDV